MANEYGEYAEPVGSPYAAWTTVEEAEKWPWPSPDWFDYSAVPALCVRYDDLAVVAGGTHVQDFINGVAFGRGIEQVLFDIAVEDPVYLYIVERRHQFYQAYIERILEAAAGRIDLVFCGDDLGSQRGLLISPTSFNKLFAAKKKTLFDLVHSYGAKVTHHCCGSSRALIPHFIQCGMDSLQTIQPQAVGMNPYALKAEFAGKIVLHGAVDVQGWLQRATPKEIEMEVNCLMDEVAPAAALSSPPAITSNRIRHWRMFLPSTKPWRNADKTSTVSANSTTRSQVCSVPALPVSSVIFGTDPSRTRAYPWLGSPQLAWPQPLVPSSVPRAPRFSSGHRHRSAAPTQDRGR